MASSSRVINAIARNRLICESTLARLCIKAPWRGRATSAAAAVSALSDSSLRLRRQKLSDHIVQEIEPPRAREPAVSVMLHQTAGAQLLELRPQQRARQARALLKLALQKTLAQPQGIHQVLERQLFWRHRTPARGQMSMREIAPRLALAPAALDAHTARLDAAALAVRSSPDPEIVAEVPVVEVVAAAAPGASGG